MPLQVIEHNPDDVTEFRLTQYSSGGVKGRSTPWLDDDDVRHNAHNIVWWEARNVYVTVGRSGYSYAIPPGFTALSYTIATSGANFVAAEPGATGSLWTSDGYLRVYVTNRTQENPAGDITTANWDINNISGGSVDMDEKSRITIDNGVYDNRVCGMTIYKGHLLRAFVNGTVHVWNKDTLNSRWVFDNSAVTALVDGTTKKLRDIAAEGNTLYAITVSKSDTDSEIVLAEPYSFTP